MRWLLLLVGCSQAPLGDVAYDEELVTILRGLQPAGGYYRMAEFRVSSAPDQHAVVLEVEKGWVECASGKVIAPHRDDEWVFSSFATLRYDAAGQEMDVSDRHGHRLELRVNTGGSCFKIGWARLDGADVGLTTQAYTDSRLNTCGVTSEPAWSSPAQPSCP